YPTRQVNGIVRPPEAGMRKTSQQPEVPEPPAYDAILQQDYERALSSIQEDPGQATRIFGDRHTTLLHAACYDNRADTAGLLIRLGAPLDAQDVMGRTPLHWAAVNGALEAIDVLLRNGANLDIRDARGHTPLNLVEGLRADPWGCEAAAKLK